jgi:hypothetical protein
LLCGTGAGIGEFGTALTFDWLPELWVPVCACPAGAVEVEFACAATKLAAARTAIIKNARFIDPFSVLSQRWPGKDY